MITGESSHTKILMKSKQSSLTAEQQRSCGMSITALLNIPYNSMYWNYPMRLLFLDCYVEYYIDVVVVKPYLV